MWQEAAYSPFLTCMQHCPLMGMSLVGRATRSTIFQLARQSEVLSSSWHGNQKYYLLVGMATRSTIFYLAWWQEVLSSGWHGDQQYYLLIGMVTRSTIFPWECIQLARWSGASSSLQKALGWCDTQKEDRRDRLVPPFRLSTCTPVLKVPTRILQGEKISKLIKKI